MMIFQDICDAANITNIIQVTVRGVVNAAITGDVNVDISRDFETGVDVDTSRDLETGVNVDTSRDFETGVDIAAGVLGLDVCLEIALEPGKVVADGTPELWFLAATVKLVVVQRRRQRVRLPALALELSCDSQQTLKIRRM